MDTKVHPLVTTLALAVMGVAVGLWVWGSLGSDAIAGPTSLEVAPSGHLYVQVGNQLLEHDADGTFLRRHDLGNLGVEDVIGEMAFFADGSLLLRTGPDTRDFGDHMRALLRGSNDASLPGAVAFGSGLHRCDLESARCTPFAEPGIDPQATFALSVDTSREAVYLADTTRHRLRWYTASGREAGQAQRGFRFPNDVVARNRRLYVVDTNHHRVRIMGTGDRWGDELGSIAVVADHSEPYGHRWPSTLAWVGSAWWIVIMQADMSGGGVYIFDSDWRYQRMLELPSDADPLAISPHAGRVLISDWRNGRIYQFTTQGERLADFASPGVDQLLTDGALERNRYERAVYAGSALMLGLFLGLFGWAVTRPHLPRPTRVATVPSSRDAPTVWLQPDAKVALRLRRILWLCLGAVATLSVFVVAMMLWKQTFDIQLPGLLAALTAVLLVIAWLAKVSMSTAIGISGDQVTLRDHTGRSETLDADQLQFEGTMLAGDSIVVFLGQPAMPLYDRQALMTHLYPRLASATSVSTWRMQALLVQTRHPQGVVTAIGIVAMMVGAVVLMAPGA